MKKHLIITVIIASFNLANSQSNCFQKGMLYTSFENYLAKKANDSVCLDSHDNKLFLNSQNLVIKESESTRKYKNDGRIWGFTRGNEFFRYLDQEKVFGFCWFARVISISDGFVLYSSTELDTYGIELNIEYFYSLGINSPAHSLKLKNLENDFQSTEFLTQIKNMYSLYDQDSSGNYLICTLYNNNSKRNK